LTWPAARYSLGAGEGFMLQILIWAVCVLIVGVGYCAMMLERIATQDRPKPSSGIAIFLLLAILAGVLLYWSLAQAEGLPGILK
jgi:protein-S-isoprenylcysteine O-methyltransferase Ste14